jgi:hypothetical protein
VGSNHGNYLRDINQLQRNYIIIKSPIAYCIDNCINKSPIIHVYILTWTEKSHELIYFFSLKLWTLSASILVVDLR